MIEIISHRGYWKTIEEKNELISFERSFSLNYGTETDVRDYNGKLVISHDIPSDKSISFSSFLNTYNKYSCSSTLALNIKADGLQGLIKEELSRASINNYFLFDMSVPDLKKSLNAELKCYTRFSDVEPIRSYLAESVGVWVDSMESDWLFHDQVYKLTQLNKKLCFVSSELHGRNHLRLWDILKEFRMSDNIIICTDLPEQATKHFGL